MKEKEIEKEFNKYKSKLIRKLGNHALDGDEINNECRALFGKKYKGKVIFSKDLILLPSDYPYLYSKDEYTKLYLGEKYHWRQVSESLVTFMTSKRLIEQHYDNLEKMGIEWTDPWEKPLHKIYETIPCLSPVPSLAIHCANINSIFGISPLVDVKKLWKDNES